MPHSSIGHRRRSAYRYSDESGETATGLPTARSSGRSEYESAYAYDCFRSTPSLQRVSLEPGGARLAHERRRRHEPRVAALALLQLGADHQIEQRRQRPHERARRGGDQDRAVAGGAVVADPPDRCRARLLQHELPDVAVDQTVHAVHARPLVPAEERPQEVAAVATVDLQVAGHAAEHAHELGGPLLRRKVGHPRPDVGLHDVGGDDRALHVEDCHDRDVALADLHPRPLPVASRELAEALRHGRASARPSGSASSRPSRRRTGTSPGPGGRATRTTRGCGRRCRPPPSPCTCRTGRCSASRTPRGPCRGRRAERRRACSWTSACASPPARPGP